MQGAEAEDGTKEVCWRVCWQSQRHSQFELLTKSAGKVSDIVNLSV